MEKVIDKLIKYQLSDNIAEFLDEDQLLDIGNKVVREYKMDRASRADWEHIIDKAMDIANQVMKGKTFPWKDAANVKFPLMSYAAIQFAARTYPELIQDGRVVEAFVSGQDPDGTKTERAKRISSYMSYQLLVENTDWEKDTDLLLHMLPIVGTVFRKTYYDPIRKHPCSEVCDPYKIVIHNSAKSVESARRISHVLNLYTNDIIERINNKLYCDIDLKLLNDSGTTMDQKSDSQDEDKYHDVIEQHRFLDLDGDGYQEPYIVTVHEKTLTVLRIVARYQLEDIILGDDDKLISIKPECYFTDYHFIPSPNGSFYSLGFGTLLYPINESINCLFNQLLDSGTLSNLQSGFIGSNLRIQGGKLNLEPGEWKKVESMGAELKDSIVPLPTKDPSQTLFNLLQLLIDAGKNLAGVIDILPDDQQTQNVPATTILSLLDQRLKPLKAIFKRIYRSFKKEFDKLYKLNGLYLPDEQIYFTILNDNQAIAKSDFQEPDYAVKPIADPSMSSESQRLLKVQSLRAALGEPGGQLLNPTEVMSRWISELNMPNGQKLIQPPQPPQPNPEMLKLQLQQQDQQRQSKKDAADYDVKIKELALRHKESEDKKQVEDAKIVNLHAKSLLDIANAHRDHMEKTNANLTKLIDMAHQKQHKDKELTLKQQEVDNDKLQPTTGVEGASSNS